MFSWAITQSSEWGWWDTSLITNHPMTLRHINKTLYLFELCSCYGFLGGVLKVKRRKCFLSIEMTRIKSVCLKTEFCIGPVWLFYLFYFIFYSQDRSYIKSVTEGNLIPKTLTLIYFPQIKSSVMCVITRLFISS